MQELVIYSVALNDSSGNSISEMENRNNLNISKLLSCYVQSTDIPKKTYKIPDEYILSLSQNLGEKEEGKSLLKTEPVYEQKIVKYVKEEEKGGMKEKAQDGFVTANLLQKSKQPTPSNNANNPPPAAVPSSIRKKFVPPFKK